MAQPPPSHPSAANTPFDEPPFSEPLAVVEISEPPPLEELTRRLSAAPSPFLLESGLDVAGMGRWHILGAHSVGSAQVWGDRTVLSAGSASGGPLATREVRGNPWATLEEWWREWARRRHVSDEGAMYRHQFPFTGGAVGYLGYELGEWIEGLPPRSARESAWPDAHLELYDEIVLVECASGRAFALHRGRAGFEARRWWLRPAPVSSPMAPSPTARTPSARAARLVSFDRAAYLSAIESVRAGIGAGDVYEVNLSARHEVAPAPCPWRLHEQLRRVQPVPYGALLPWQPAAVVSASPERFLRRRRQHVETRPIKGTSARGADAAEDEARARTLLDSEKERAELAMIIDLERNDLGKVCKAGTVVVHEEAAVEAYSTVLHTVATVRGVLEDRTSPFTLLAATFPGGSITGAPKRAAMQFIRRLEPVERGVYTGSIGWIAPNGDLDLSIAIRTVCIAGGRAYCSVGGAVTWDSDPESEYAELEAKGRAIFGALLGPEALATSPTTPEPRPPSA